MSSAVAVRRAETAEDFEAARTLCRAFVAWQLKVFPGRREQILSYFNPETYERTLADLERIHAPPEGAVLLASLDGWPAGCVMYRELAPGVAEVKRLFVDEKGRGHGLGAALLADMIDRLRSAGYGEVRLDSAKFLTHAKRLYDRMGFVEDMPPAGSPDHVYFMSRRLQGE